MGAGPNVVRNLQSFAGAEVLSVCDNISAARRRTHRGTFPGIYVTANASERMNSPEIDAVALVTQWGPILTWPKRLWCVHLGRQLQSKSKHIRVDGIHLDKGVAATALGN